MISRYLSRYTFSTLLNIGTPSKLVAPLGTSKESSKELLHAILAWTSKPLRATPIDSKSFLNVRNRDFGEKIPSNIFFINDYPNIAIFYSGFLASQK